MSANNSFDIGDVTGAESKILSYVPGKPLAIFVAGVDAGLNSSVGREGALKALKTHIGEFELVEDDPEVCEFCVVLPQLDGRIAGTVFKQVDTFFSRFGAEARVYLYDHIEDQLFFKSRAYFENPRRIDAFV